MLSLLAYLFYVYPATGPLPSLCSARLVLSNNTMCVGQQHNGERWVNTPLFMGEGQWMRAFSIKQYQSCKGSIAYHADRVYL